MFCFCFTRSILSKMSTFRILYGGETGEGHAVFFHLFQFLFRHQEVTGIRSGCRPINCSGAENAVLSSLEIIGKHLRIHDSVQNHPPNQWFFNPPVGIKFFVLICMDQFSVFIPVVFTTDDHTVCKTAVTLKGFHTDRITVRIIFCPPIPRNVMNVRANSLRPYSACRKSPAEAGLFRIYVVSYR